MLKEILRLSDKAIDKYQSEGVVPLLGAIRWYSLHTLHNKIESRRVFCGEHQFKLITMLRHRVHQVRYLAPASPYKPIWIDPRKVGLKTGKFKRYLGLGQIKGGDWDRPENAMRFEDDWIYIGLKQRFEEDCDWEQTVYYETMRQRFDEGGTKWNYDSKDQFLRVRCAYVDDLFESIQSEGYRRNESVNHDVPKQDIRNRQYDQRLEPFVVIGRNGEILLRDGLHRFAIARILGIEPIPVNVLGRHFEWQEVRDEFSKVDTLSELDSKLQSYIDHPDLAFPRKSPDINN